MHLKMMCCPMDISSRKVPQYFGVLGWWEDIKNSGKILWKWIQLAGLVWIFQRLFSYFADKKEEIHPYLFIPFQAGPRICLGQTMAYLEIKIATIMILQQFRFSVVPGHIVEPVYNITLNTKNGVQMNVHTRKSQKAWGIHATSCIIQYLI